MPIPLPQLFKKLFTPIIVRITVPIALYSIKRRPNLDFFLFLNNKISPAKKQIPKSVKTKIKMENVIETIDD